MIDKFADGVAPSFYMILNSSWSQYFIKVKNKICGTRRSFVCCFFASHKMFKNHCPMSKCLVMVDMKTKEENEEEQKTRETNRAKLQEREKTRINGML